MTDPKIPDYSSMFTDPVDTKPNQDNSMETTGDGIPDYFAEATQAEGAWDVFKTSAKAAYQDIVGGLDYALGDALSSIPIQGMKLTALDAFGKSKNRSDKAEEYRDTMTQEQLESWPSLIGSATVSVVPSVAGMGLSLAGAPAIGAPLAQAGFAGLAGSTYGNALKEYDEYKKAKGEEQNPLERYSVALANAGVEYASERLGVAGDFIKAAGRGAKPIIKTSVKESIDAGKEIITKYLKSSPEKYKQLAKVLSKSAASEGASEALAELSQGAITNWYKDVEDRQDFVDLLDGAWKAGVIGGGLGLGMGPLSYKAQNKADRQRRESNKIVRLAKLGEDSVEIISQKPSKDGKDSMVTIMHPDGHVKDVAESQIGETVDLSTNQFYNLLKGKSEENIAIEQSRIEQEKSQRDAINAKVNEDFGRFATDDGQGNLMVTTASYKSTPVFVVGQASDSNSVFIVDSASGGGTPRMVDVNRLTNQETTPLESIRTGILGNLANTPDQAGIPPQIGEEIEFGDLGQGKIISYNPRTGDATIEFGEAESENQNHQVLHRNEIEAYRAQQEVKTPDVVSVEATEAAKGFDEEGNPTEVERLSNEDPTMQQAEQVDFELEKESIPAVKTDQGFELERTGLTIKSATKIADEINENYPNSEAIVENRTPKGVAVKADYRVIIKERIEDDANADANAYANEKQTNTDAENKSDKPTDKPKGDRTGDRTGKADSEGASDKGKPKPKSKSTVKPKPKKEIDNNTRPETNNEGDKQTVVSTDPKRSQDTKAKKPAKTEVQDDKEQSTTEQDGQDKKLEVSKGKDVDESSTQKTKSQKGKPKAKEESGSDKQPTRTKKDERSKVDGESKSKPKSDDRKDGTSNEPKKLDSDTRSKLINDAIKKSISEIPHLKGTDETNATSRYLKPFVAENKAKIEESIDKVLSKYKQIKRDDVKVWESILDFQMAYPEERIANPNGIPGVFHDGKIHIIASHPKFSKGKVLDTILHEGVGHYGLRRMFGISVSSDEIKAMSDDEFNAFRDRQGEFNAFIDSVYAKYKDDPRFLSIAKRYYPDQYDSANSDKEFTENLTTRQNRVVTEEIVAHEVEKDVDDFKDKSLLDSLVEYIRKAWKNLTGTDLDLTNDEIRQIVSASKKFLQTGDVFIPKIDIQPISGISDTSDSGMRFQREVTSFKRGGNLYVSTEVDGELVGTAMFAADGEVMAVDVDEDFRRQGIATEMYKHAKAKGVDVKPGSIQTEDAKKFWDGARFQIAPTEDTSDIRFQRITVDKKDLQHINIAYGSEEKFNENIEKTISFVKEESIGFRDNNRGYGDIQKIQKRTVLEGFAERGFTDFSGIKVNNAQDVADLFLIHRSPYIEKAHVVFLDSNNTIIQTRAKTLNMAGVASIHTTGEINSIAEKIGAKSYYLLHNHPSGNANPSKQDIVSTVNSSKEATIPLNGHIVINTDKFCLINKDGEHTLLDYKANPEPLFKDRINISGADAQEKMAELGEQLLKRDGIKVAVIYLTPKLDIAAYDSLPSDISLSDLKESVSKGMNAKLGHSYIIAHDSSIEGDILEFPSGIMDVINISGNNNYFRNYPRRLTVNDIENLWEPRSNYDPSDNFYSNSLKAVANINQPKATADQWKSMLLKNGASEQELKWIGFDQYISQFKGKSIPKDNILDFLASNQIEVQEVVKDRDLSVLRKDLRNNRFVSTGRHNIEYLDKDTLKVTDIEKGLEFEFIDVDDAFEFIAPREGATQYHSLTLRGGDKYKELLLTMPNLKRSQGTQESYKSTHWGESNILSHIRFNERVVNDGRVMFIEELQSDWAQDGRKKGFKDKWKKELLTVFSPDQAKEYSIGGNMWGVKAINEQGQQEQIFKILKSKAPTEQDAIDYVIANKARSGEIEPMPFDRTQDWLNLSIRRIIRYASENGFDRIAFVNGQQSADRYDLSKQVSKVSVLKGRDEGTYQLVIEDNASNEVSPYKGSGKIVTAQELEDTIGKELAKKAIESTEAKAGKTYSDNEWTDFKEDGLKVGGEGMINFYDKIVPNVSSKLLKKLDKTAKMEVIEIETSGVDKTPPPINEFTENAVLDELPSRKSQQQSFPITPRIRQTAIKEGMPLFQRIDTLQETDGQFTKKHDHLVAMWQDRMIYMRRLQELNYNDKQIADELNVYDKENLSKGVVNEQMRVFKKDLWKPLENVLADINKDGVSVEESSRYLKAKHIVEDDVFSYKWKFENNKYDVSIEGGKMNTGLSESQAKSMLKSNFNAVQSKIKVERSKDKSKKVFEGEFLGGGISLDESKKLVDSFEKSTKRSKDLMDNIRKINQFVLDKRLESGMISSEAHSKMLSQFNFYVPLRGFHEAEADPTVFTKEFKREGRESESGDPMGYLGAMAQTAIQKGEQNKVLQSLYRFVVENPDSKIYEIKTAFYLKDKESGNLIDVMHSRPTKEQFKEYDISMTDPSISDEDSYKLYKQRTAFERENISLKIDGKTVTLEFLGEDGKKLAAAIKGQSIEKAPSWISWVGQYTATLRKLYTQYSPEFAIRNFIRDTFTGLINVRTDLGIKASLEVAGNIPKSMGTLRKWAFSGGYDLKSEDGKLLKEFVESGALTGYSELKTVEEYRKELENSIKLSQGAMNGFDRTKNLTKETVGNILGVIDKTNQMFENTTRFAAYKALRNQGKSPQQAAIYAKDLTVNFNRKGNISDGIGTFYLFFNASVQGVERLARPFIRGTREQKVRAYTQALLTLPSIHVALSILNKMWWDKDDDDEYYYDKLPEYIKTHNLTVPNFFSDKPGTFLHIPLPYGFNVMFTWPEMVMSAIEGRISPAQAALKTAASVSESFSPLGSPNFDGLTPAESMMQYFAPTASKAIVDVAINKNFMGSPIYKEPYPGQTPEPNSQMYFSSVNPLIRSMTDTLNAWTGGDEIDPGDVDINPEIIEHFITSWTGGVGKFISNSVTTVTNISKGKNPASYEDDQIRKTPFLRNYTSQVPEYYSQYKFYELVDEVETKRDILNRYVNSGNREAAKNYRELNKDYIRLAGVAKNYNGSLKTLRNKKKALEAMGRNEEADRLDDKMNEMYLKYIKIHNAKIGKEKFDWKEFLGM